MPTNSDGSNGGYLNRGYLNAGERMSRRNDGAHESYSSSTTVRA
ncbi:MAG TPA: hypothetical protein VKR52_11900 [Terracidiphilus sp.]|nr:hypothetical protein [Terracidiphilus sp.]